MQEVYFKEVQELNDAHDETMKERVREFIAQKAKEKADILLDQHDLNEEVKEWCLVHELEKSHITKLINTEARDIYASHVEKKPDANRKLRSFVNLYVNIND